MTEWPHLLRQVSLQGEGTHSEERPWGREAETAARRLQALGHLQPQNRAETRTRLPLTACRRDQPSRHLTSRLGPPEPWKATFLLFPATYFVGKAAMGRESSVPTPRCTSAQAGKRGPREPGPCEPCFSLQSAHSELPKRRSPGPCWMRRGVLGPTALPGCRRGHVPWVTPGAVRFPMCPSPPVPQRTDTAQVLDPSHKPSVSSGDAPAGPRQPGPRAAAEPQGGGRAC